MAKIVTVSRAVILACCLFAGDIVSATSCNADNCLRALFPTPSPAAYSAAAAFCATYTTTVNTQTTGFPTRASSACGTATARYSSACSCKPTLSSTLTSSATPTPTCQPSRPANDAVSNGGFECGLAPWVAKDILNTKHSITSPGDASGFAYQFNQLGPQDPDAGLNPAAVYQDLKLVSGVSYNLRFRTFFDKCTTDEGFVGVMLNRSPVYTVDACDKGAGAFKDNLVQFVATSDQTELRFDFITREDDAVIKIDNVSVVPQH
ncbi:MAG: hypothetical protein Q9197_002918 [Variospora fuerteventurae]